MSFSIIRNDITKVKADAIVNTANPRPVIGGGTDTAVYNAAGMERLLEKRKEIGDIAPGHAVETPAFDLSAKYIIHTVGPVWQGGNEGEAEILRGCYRNSLDLAANLGCESIAFPLIATGTYEFPRALALEIAMESFREFEEKSDEDMEILLVVFDRESFVISDSVFQGVEAFIDGNYVEEKLDEEYSIGSSLIDRAEGSPRRNAAEGSFHKGVAEEASRRDAAEESPRNRKSDHREKRFMGLSGNALGSVFGKKAKSDAKRCEEELEEELEEADFTDACAAPAEVAQAEETISMPEPLLAKQAERSLQDVMAQVGETWQQSLFRYIDEKGFTDTEVYKRANVDRKLFSKIRSNEDYQPKKITAVAFALALRLNLDETKDFIARAGYAFSPGSRFDLIVEYYIGNKQYDTYIINATLFEYDQPLIGA